MNYQQRYEQMKKKIRKPREWALRVGSNGEAFVYNGDKLNYPKDDYIEVIEKNSYVELFEKANRVIMHYCEGSGLLEWQDFCKKKGLK